jgi:osmotically-inducible protein OsmY
MSSVTFPPQASAPAPGSEPTDSAALGHGLGIALVMGALPALAAAPTEAAIAEARLEGRIGTALLLDRTLHPFDLEVDVDGDTAILRGTVDADGARDRAERVVRVTGGVGRVDNRIAVERGTPRVVAPRTLDGARLDASISAAVRSRLLWHDATARLPIAVETRARRVTLSGRVADVESRLAAARVAHAIDGVRSVDNRIAVVPPRAAADGARRAPAQTGEAPAATRARDDVAGLGLEVETKEGVTGAWRDELAACTGPTVARSAVAGASIAPMPRVRRDRWLFPVT